MKITLIETIPNWSFPKKMAVVVTVALVVFLIGFLILNLPQIHTISRYKQEESALTLNLHRLIPEASSISQQQHQVEEFSKWVSERQQLLAKPETLSDTLATITKSSTDNHVNLILLKPNISQQEEFYAKIPIDIKVMGSYAQLVRFLNQLSSMKYYLHLKTIRASMISVEKEGDKEKNKETTVSMTLTVELYYFSPKPKEKQKGSSHVAKH